MKNYQHQGIKPPEADGGIPLLLGEPPVTFTAEMS